MQVKIENLVHSYQQSDSPIQVLKGVNLEVKEGEVVAILGQSGSGKSTLLSLLGGLDQVQSGRIAIGPHQIDRMSEVELTSLRSKSIGIIFQQFHLIDYLSAIENVMVPLEILNESNPYEKAKSVLEEVGLGSRLNHRTWQLSGGEAQRVAIARALVIQPQILLADEPTGNLDSATGEKVLELFFRVARQHKITTVLVTHNEEFAQRCDRQLKMQQGLIQ